MLSTTELLETLADWNYWNRPLPGTFSREKYEKEVLTKSETGEIVVLQGVRRSGKSTILQNTIRRLVENGVAARDILFVNLEDPRFFGHLTPGLLSRIKEVYLQHLNPGGVPYLILDEVQNVPGFEKWLLKEYELGGARLFVTGSNSRLSSREIGTALVGRYLDVRVFPLDFREFLEFHGLNPTDRLELAQRRIEVRRLFDEYVEYGGFPKVVLTDDMTMKRAEVKIYFDSIVLRDIVARYRLDNFEALLGLAVYLLSHASSPLSLNGLKNHFGLSFDLVERYVAYLENAYLVFRVPRFDWSLKRQRANPRKIYAVDTGLANAVSFQVGQRVGQCLENLVFLELLRRGEEVYYCKTQAGYEVDFLVKRGPAIVQLIQVCTSLENRKTRERELRSLVRAAGEIPHAGNAELLVLVPDHEETLMKEGKEIRVVELKSWLLGLA